MSRTILCLSVFCYLCSLPQDCYYVDLFDPRAWSPGWVLLVFGWLGIPFGYLMWIANPLLYASWYCCLCNKYEKALLCSLIALVLMLSFLLCKRVVVGDSPMYSVIIGYGVGYYLWVASGVLVVIAGFLGLKRS
jgi:hypothetical protein